MEFTIQREKLYVSFDVKLFENFCGMLFIFHSLFETYSGQIYKELDTHSFPIMMNN